MHVKLFPGFLLPVSSSDILPWINFLCLFHCCSLPSNSSFFFSQLYIMMLGAKAPNYDTYGLFRAMHSHNPTHYSHIVKLPLHFYAHIGRVPRPLHHLCASTGGFRPFDPGIIILYEELSDLLLSFCFPCRSHAEQQLHCTPQCASLAERFYILGKNFPNI